MSSLGGVKVHRGRMREDLGGARSAGSSLANQQLRSSTIRRWQTFSPSVAAGNTLTEEEYRCRVNK